LLWVSTPEARIRGLIRFIAWQPERLAKWAYRKIKEAVRVKFFRTFEWYLDHKTGEVKLGVRKTMTGSYKTIDGKDVKVSDHSNSVIDVYSFMPWSEVNAGKVDPELGVVIKSKDDYRREMKRQHLIPYEKNRYGKSARRVREEVVARAQEKYKPAIEKAFKEACDREGI
jgi:hypothetical protein